MNIVCIGGGPAGLYFALLMKQQDPTHRIRVVERNRPYDTFGWGVVFSDQTLGNLQAADAPTAAEILGAFNHWDDIEVNIGGHRIGSGGHGFCGIGRKRLLNILQRRCEALGVELVFETDVRSDEEFADADLVIASDGLNSRMRANYTDTFQPDIDLRQCRFVWLGTHRKFDAFTFAFEETPHGWFQAHAYQFDGDTSTFIVEAPEQVWRDAGLEDMSKEESIAFCERLFAKYLDGHALMSNAVYLRGSAQWIRFPRVVCRTWVHRPEGRAPLVLMGDAAHTAHFSIGSGTKLALEDAIELARCIGSFDGLRTGSPTLRPFDTLRTGEAQGERVQGEQLMEALRDYEAVRSIEVLRIQNAARNSTEWFENVARYARLPPQQFAYSLLTRSQRISHENLRLRDRDYVERYEDHRRRPGRPLRHRKTASREPRLDLARNGQDRVHRSPVAAAVPRRQDAARTQPRAREGGGDAERGPVRPGAGPARRRCVAGRGDDMSDATDRVDPALAAGNRKHLAGYRATHVLWEVQGKVATVTPNRPERKNPLTFDSYAEPFVAKSKPRFEGN